MAAEALAMTDEAPKIIPFGKYKGRFIDEVLVDDPNYLLAGDDSESIVLNRMQPQAAGRQRVGFGGEARRNEAGRKSTRTGQHDVGINRQRWSRVEGPRGYGLGSQPWVGARGGAFAVWSFCRRIRPIWCG